MSGVCGRGTFNGAAAEASPYLFAPCTLHAGHSGDCDAGPDLIGEITRVVRDAPAGFKADPL